MKSNSKNRNTFKRIAILLAVFVCAVLHSQTYPVQVTPQLIPPYSLKISDYATTTSEKLYVNILLTDVNEIGRRVRLKMYIEGQGLSITTRDVIIGETPIYLDGGINLRLSNVDLQPYFQLNNLAGITPEQYNLPLPNGGYNFCFEVYDYFTNRRVSAKSCTTAYLLQNDPPILNLPFRDNIVNATNPQNILFTWTPRHSNANNVQYEFTLKELWDIQNPQANFLASVPFYQTNIYNTTLLVGPEAPQLLSGKIYGWQVRAFVSDGINETSVFKNDGKSEIFWFKYIENCQTPSFVISQALTAESVQVNWQSSEHLRYRIQYRKKGFSDDDWFEVNSFTNEGKIRNLEPDTVYEFRVGGECTQLSGFAYSNIQEFTTPSNDEAAYYNCGLTPQINITNKEPLPKLGINETFTAGDFPVTTREVTGSNGTFSGWGYITLPFLENLKEIIDAVNIASSGSINIGKYTRIKVVFKNVQVNSSYELTDGVVVTDYDPDWKNIFDADEVINDIVGDNGAIENFDATNTDIKDVTVDENGNILIIPEEGDPIPIQTQKPVTITDKNGDQWTVHENGKVTKGKAAEGGAPSKDTTEGISNSGKVTQISSKDVEVTFNPSGYYGTDFYQEDIKSDTYKNEYEFIKKHDDGEYSVLYKLLSDLPEHTTDSVKATVKFSNGKTKNDIVFKTKEGTAVTTTWSGNEATLALQRRFEFAKEEILATVKPKDSTEKYTIAGKLNVWHTQQQTINLTLVSVDDAPLTNIKERINEIYNKAGIHFNINTESINLGLGNLDVGDSDMLSNYTEGEKAIISAFKNIPDMNVEKERYYMFFLDDKKVTLSKALNGFMPLKRQFGFVFTQQDAGRIAAHELGHGIFGLKHPFDQYNAEEARNENHYLMSYGTGTAFSHMDWQKLHAPGIQLYWFQGDEAGEDRANDGIDFLGNIITLVEYDESKIKVVGIIDKKYPYLRYGYKVYPNRDNEEVFDIYYAQVNGNKVSYVSNEGKTIPYNIKITNKGLAKIKVSRDNCTYNVTEIQWEKDSFNSVADVINKINEEVKKQNPKWKLYSYNKLDPSCKAANLLADILKNDASSPCANAKTVQEGFDKIKIVFSNNSATENEIVDAINSNCLSSLRLFADEEIIKIFRILAVSEEIKEEKEIAILRLMAVIKSSNYEKFFNVLKENNNKIYANLLNRIEDSSFYWFGKDSLKNFLEVLLFMHNNSSTVDVRVDLIKLLIQFQADDPMNDPKSAHLVSEDNINQIFNKDIKVAEREYYFTSLQENNFKLFKDYHNSLRKQRYTSKLWNDTYQTLITLIAEKGTSQDVIYLFENINLSNTEFVGNGYWNKIFKSFLFTKFPSDKQKFYTYLSENNFEKFLQFIKSVGEHPPHNKAEELLKRTIEGFSKLIDEEGKITDKIVLVNWLLDNPDAFSSEENSFGELLVGILNGISTQEDKDFIYGKLSHNKHELFIKCAEALSGSTDYLFKLSETYSKLISEATEGKVQDRIDIINHAISKGKTWNWFWFSSDQEDIISAMFSDMSSSQAREFIEEFKKDEYELFFKIWEVLKSRDWWAAIDGDNKRFENFVTLFGKNFIMAGELAESVFPDDLIDYKDEKQKYLSSKVDGIDIINGNYVPMTRASFFNGTDGLNDYKLEAEAITANKLISVTINIKDSDGKNKDILARTFKPFDYVFIELLEDVKVSETLTYNKGDILAIPAFYLAWMDGYIDSQQLSTVLRVGGDVVVVVASAAAAVGTGGASLAVLGAEIFFASTDALIAIQGDEMKKIFGDDFVDGLEIANMAWGLANLPAAVATIPKGLAKLRISATKTLESGTDAFRSFVKNAKNLENVKLDLDLTKLAKAIKALKETDRVAYIKTLRNKIADIAIKYDNLVESGVPSEKIKKIYSSLRRMLFSVSSNGEILDFNRISDDVVNLVETEIKILNKSLITNKSGKYLDIVIHASVKEPGKFTIILNGVEETIEAVQLADKLKDADPTKTIRLLSCNDSNSAIEISQSLGRDIIHSTGDVKIYENGVIETNNWKVAKTDGVVDDFNIATATGSGESVTLFKNYVKELSKATKADLLAVLGQSRFDEFIIMLEKSRVPANWKIEKVGEAIMFVEDIDGNPKVWAEFAKKQDGKLFMKATGGPGDAANTRKINYLLDVDPPLMKGFRYEVDNGRFIFETDALGRVHKITDNNVRYDVPTRRYENSQQKAKNIKDGNTGSPPDDGGHMISAESGGPVEQINYFPQNRNYNQKLDPGTWRKMEEYLKSLKDANSGDTFKFEVLPVFGDVNRPGRPTMFRVKISQNGTPVSLQEEFREIDNPF
ncbi:DNA/RNA non-specific endonuclease [Tenacibaculum tangerinum]|uniref:DNA/RNA non-specific endonuclease n=1 Tax=Tenacibaculum tangerinum TaxID=3038772 RepID=A0ABY8L764_9FLAO|nr:DNA/RNA non-specific endonuclease [Tenacibaculum tangerinum]WGH76033.1 DNA/RNA non-specific endonuclease [Tenacibaculum tangerinum]